MNLTLPIRAASTEEIIANPMFRQGYDDGFCDDSWNASYRWDDGEQEAYERGRQFAAVVRGLGEGRVPLTRGAMVHPRARVLLAMAMQSGEVL